MGEIWAENFFSYLTSAGSILKLCSFSYLFFNMEISFYLFIFNYNLIRQLKFKRETLQF